jgi:HEAT repeat protein
LSIGSGELLDTKHRLVMTNCHVVGDADTVIVNFPEFDKQKKEWINTRTNYMSKKGLVGRVIMREPRADLALVQLDRLPEGVKPLALAKESAPQGAQVHSLGNAAASMALWNYTPGQVRQPAQVQEIKFAGHAELGEEPMHLKARMLETTSPINAGDSGGPLVDARGVLVGVCDSQRVRDSSGNLARNVSTFIDVTEVRALMEKFYKDKNEKWVEVPAPRPRGSGTRGVADLIKMLTGPDITQRVKAAERLGEYGADAKLAFGSLFDALKDKNALVSHAAADALEKVPPHKGDLDMLREAVKSKTEKMAVRVQAAKSLGRLGSDARRAVPDLTALVQESDEGLCAAALGALASIGPEAKDAPALGKGLQSPSAEIRRLSMEALARLGPKASGAVPSLKAALKDGDKAIKVQAAKTLEAIGSAAASAVPALTETLKDTDPEVSAAAAQALMKLGSGKDVVKYLAEILKSGAGQDQKKEVIKLLMQAGHDALEASTQLVNALDDDALRSDASDALVKIGKRAVTSVVFRISKCLNPNARRARIEILRRIASAGRLGAPYKDEALGALRYIVQHDAVAENRTAAQEVGTMIQSKG